MGHLNYPVLYKTTETIDQVNQRLATQCEGTWKVEVDRTDSKKNNWSLRVLFERESDILSLLRPVEIR